MGANGADTAKKADNETLDALAFADKRLEEAKEEKAKRKKALIKFGTMTVLTALVLIFGTIAWFTMSKELTAGSMGVKGEDVPFELATKYDKISYEAKLTEADEQYAAGQSKTYKNEDGKEENFYISQSGKSLILQCTDGDKNVGPSGSSRLNLYLVSLNGEDIDVNISFKTIGYTEVYMPVLDENENAVLDDEGNPTYQPKLIRTADLTAENTLNSKNIKEEDLDKYHKAADYISGHIMFFSKEADNTSREEGDKYYYEDPMDFDADEGVWTLHFTKEDTDADTAYEVPAFWMWPNTLGQIALMDNTAGLRKGYPVVSDDRSEDKAKVIAYLKDNKANIFANAASIEDAMIENAASSINVLSSGYNDADLDIGTYISYFMIEITVEQAS